MNPLGTQGLKTPSRRCWGERFWDVRVLKVKVGFLGVSGVSFQGSWSRDS